MSSTIDEVAVDQKITDLQSKSDTIRTQLDQIRMVQNNLSKIKRVLVRTDVINKIPTPVFAEPVDMDMGGVTMDPAKKQAIHDTNMALADKLLTQ